MADDCTVEATADDCAFNNANNRAKIFKWNLLFKDSKTLLWIANGPLIRILHINSLDSEMMREGDVIGTEVSLADLEKKA